LISHGPLVRTSLSTFLPEPQFISIRLSQERNPAYDVGRW
jgi:hypothetical protein